MKLTDCYYEKKDWRACKKEVSFCCFFFLFAMLRSFLGWVGDASLSAAEMGPGFAKSNIGNPRFC